jgi:putative aldouronate transport system substrate-binding protein
MLPSFVPVQAATPDLPATAVGLDPAFMSYPRRLIKSVPQTPGSCRDVNEDLNANMKMVLASAPDYPSKLATTMAGGDLTDLLYFLIGVNFAEIPRFLSTSLRT